MKRLAVFLLLITVSVHAEIIKEIDFNRSDLHPLLAFSEGENLTPSKVKRTITNLYKTGLFFNVKVSAYKIPGGLKVVITTQPAKYFGKIKTEGKIGIKKRRLKKLFKELYPYKEHFRKEIFNDFLNSLTEKFKELGFPDIKVEYKLNESGKFIDPVLQINCGKPLVVAKIKVNDRKLYKKFVKIREGDIYNKELFVHGIKKLKNFLRQKHFLNSKVDFSERIEGKKVFLTINIDKGRKFSLTTKNLEINKEEIENICVFLKNGKLDDLTKKITEKNLYFEALKKGYSDPEIKLEITNDNLYCEIVKPKKEEITSIVLNSNIKIPFESKYKYYNKLTKSKIYGEISNYLKKEGYLTPSVKFSYSPETGVLTVNVKEGPKYLFGKITVDSPVEISSTFLSHTVKENMPFDKEKLLAIIPELRAYLLVQGYYNPQVKVRVGKAENNKIPVIISIIPGKKVILKDIVIVGNKKVSDQKIIKMAPFKTGEYLSLNEIEEFRNNLEMSGLFDKIETELVESDNSGVLLVKVRESRLYSFSYAVGINSDESLRFTAKVKKKYLFNTFLTGTTIFRVSAKRVQGYFTVSGEKHFLSSVYFTVEDKDDYKFSRYGFSLSYSINLFSNIKFVESLEFTKNNLTNLNVPIEEIDKDLHPDYTAGLRTNLLWDKRDNVLFPTKGFFGNTSLFPAYVLNDDEFFLKAKVKAGFYFGNLEIIQTIGKIFTKNGYRIPLPQRFFAGGSTDIRIASFEKAGPMFSTGVPEGGNFLFVFTAEYKYHLGDIYYLTFFTDIGNVWKDSSDFSLDSAIKDAGIGFLVKTPVGPIKIQLATNLDKGSYPSRYKLVFTMGATF